MMYSQQALPKSYGTMSYGRSKGANTGVIANVALVVALVLCGGLSLMLVSTRSQLRSMHAHHDALQEELTYSKNHLHQVEAQYAAKSQELAQLQKEVNDYTAHHSIQELEALRNYKRTHEASVASGGEDVKQIKEELEAAHALIDAYKHHLSDEVAAHHAREEAWLSVQQDWEKLEREFQAEIDALRGQLASHHIKVNEAAHVDAAQHHPQHMQPEVQRHDPLLDSLPPPHSHVQQQHHQPEHHAAVPPPAAAPHGSAAPVYQHHDAQHGAHHGAHHDAQHAHHAPAGGHMPPPHPAEVPRMHHDDHYGSHAAQQHAHAQAGQQHHAEQHHAAVGGHHEWAPTDSDYGKLFDHHTAYADYPGFVDDTHAAQQQDQAHTQHAQQQHAQHGTHQYHADLDAHAAVAAGHHDAHAHGQQQQQQQQHHEPHATWQQQQQQHHHHDAHTAAQQQHHAHGHGGQQQHHEDHAYTTGRHHSEQHAQLHAEQQEHHIVDDLAMKLGLGGGHHEQLQQHHEQPPPQQQHHHH